MFRKTIITAGLASAVVAETSCPLTTTSTRTSTTPSAVYIWETVDGKTPLPTDTYTTTIYTATDTTITTVADTSYVTNCAFTSTKNIEYTPTAYTGDFTSSALRTSTSCAPSQLFLTEWPGTTTTTATVTQYSTNTYLTETASTPSQSTEWTTSGLTTLTRNLSCTATLTSTTATAASTTQALKCAPTNLIGTDGKPGRRYRGAANDGIASYGSGSSYPPGFDNRTGAHKDAGACCQACQEAANCAASIFTGTDSTYPAPSLPWCQFFDQNDSPSSYYSDEGDEEAEGCGLGFTIFPGDMKMAQAGCGYIAANAYAEGLCEGGMTARECQESGVGGLVN
ncbi:hypothetical protein D0860_05798 [Hortaea werneckii]|uniref:Apple domain-containing protein n=1 Tax=Hortaea werneckii TaxID=91943 RepID=A0A3M7GXA6_HORWE|nr:hypothetical protein D0860_05798 [Hortaea werneckii]